MLKPFAIELYERFRSGESVEQLAAIYGMPVERIAARIRAAESYTRRQEQRAGEEHGIGRRLAEGAAVLDSLARERDSEAPMTDLEREIIGRELLELELDVLRDAGALERMLVPVRRSVRRAWHA